MAHEKRTELDELASELRQKREYHSLGISLKHDSEAFIHSILSVLFPHYTKDKYSSLEGIKFHLFQLEKQLKLIVSPLLSNTSLYIEDVTDHFFKALPDVYHKLWYDAQAIFEGDPAALSVDEVIFTYPGFFAIAIYRLAHEFYKLQVPVFPRLLTEYAHEKTAIDIHPGAKIGESFAIDHGTGIVIGESTIVGSHVKLYQGVTLGALSVDKQMASQKRHPTIEDHVVIYAHAVVLGGKTVVGHHSVVGGNVWMTASVPPNSVVYHHRDIFVQNTSEYGGAPDWVI
jgi:serine O-acetyltransferase